MVSWVRALNTVRAPVRRQETPGFQPLTVHQTKRRCKGEGAPCYSMFLEFGSVAGSYLFSNAAAFPLPKGAGASSLRAHVCTSGQDFARRSPCLFLGQH